MCSSCNSAGGLCGLNREPGAAVIPEYEPQRTSEETEPWTKPTESKATEAKDETRHEKKDDASLPADFEYVPDSPNRTYHGDSADSAATAAQALPQPNSPQPTSDVQAQLRSALERSSSDIRELETLLEEARQVAVDAPLVDAVQQRVRALRAVEAINQAAGQGNHEKLAKALQDARNAGVSEDKLVKAVERLDALLQDWDRQRRLPQEQKPARPKPEVAFLRRAIEAKDPDKLSLAIQGAERGGDAPAEEVEAAKKLLAELQASKKSAGRSMFTRKSKS